MKTFLLLTLALLGLAAAESSLLSVFQPGQPFPEIFVSVDELGRVAQDTEAAGHLFFMSADQTHQCSSVSTRNAVHATKDIVLLCDDLVPQDWTPGAPVSATIGAGIKPVHVGYVFSQTVETGETEKNVVKRSLNEHEMFMQWAELYIAGENQDENEGASLAKNRMLALKDMRKNYAEAACHLRIPAVVRSKLPQSVLQFVEVPLDTTATLTHLMAYGEEHSHSVFQSLQLSVTEQSFDRVSSGQRAHIRTEKPVPVWGYYFANDYTAVISRSAARPAEPQEFAETGKRFATATSQIAVVGGKPVAIPSNIEIHQFGLQIAAQDLNENVKLPEANPIKKRGILQDPPSANAIRPVKTLLYVMTYFTDTNGSYTLDRCRWSIGNSSLFFADSTYGKLNEFFTIFRFAQLSKCATCYTSQSEVEAEARTLVRDVDWNEFDHWAVLYPGAGPGAFAGLATIGSRGMWLKSTSVDVFVHELGHNLGVGHSNFGATYSARSISKFDEIEYNSPGDWMGRGGGINAHWSTGHKDRIQLLPFTSVLNPVSSGTYRIYAHDIASILGNSMPQALRIAPPPRFIQGNVEFAYFVEYRNRSQNSLSGVSINMIRYLNYFDSFLLSSVPTHMSSFGRGASEWSSLAVLPQGSTFVEETLKMSITNRGTGMTNGLPWVDLEVWLPAPSSNNNPTGTISGPATIAAVNGNGTYSISASDADGDTLSYTWYADWLLVPAAASASSVVIAWPQVGNRTVRCHIADGKGGLSIVTYRVQVGSNAQALAVVSGTVLEAGTNTPIKGAQVFQTSNGARFGVTANDGTYTISGINTGSTVTFGATAPLHTACTPTGSNSIASTTRLVVTGFDWTCAPLPFVSISAPATPIANNTVATVTVSRTGSTTGSLSVGVFCYSEVTNTIRMNDAAAGALNVTIPSGASSATFEIRHLRPENSDRRQMMAFCNLVESNTYIQSNVRASVPLSGFTGPTHDSFANAVVLSGAVTSHSGFFNNATTEVDEPSTKINNGLQFCPSLWFRWTAPTSGNLRISWNATFASNANVYVGSNIASLRSVTTRWGRSTPLQVAVVASTQYYIHFFSCSQPIWRPGLANPRLSNYTLSLDVVDTFTLPPTAVYSPIFLTITPTPGRAALNPDGSPAVANGQSNAAVAVSASWAVLVLALASVMFQIALSV